MKILPQVGIVMLCVFGRPALSQSQPALQDQKPAKLMLQVHAGSITLSISNESNKQIFFGARKLRSFDIEIVDNITNQAPEPLAGAQPTAEQRIGKTEGIYLDPRGPAWKGSYDLAAYYALVSGHNYKITARCKVGVDGQPVEISSGTVVFHFEQTK